MFTINQDLLHEALSEIINRIEACGASVELTHAVSLASDLQRAVGNKFNPSDPYSLIRVVEEIKKSSN